MLDDPNVKDDANPYATPSTNAFVQQVPDREKKIRGRGWMAFSAYFCTAIAGGIFGFPFAQALGVMIGFVWAGFVGTVPFLVMALLSRSEMPTDRFRVGLALSGALTGFACVCLPFSGALWNPQDIGFEGIFPLALGALSAAVLGGIGSLMGSFLPRERSTWATGHRIHDRYDLPISLLA